MYLKPYRLTLGIALAALLLLPGASFSAEEPVVVKNYGDAMQFFPQVEAEDMILTVTGPCNYEITRSLREDGELVFKLDETTIDGMFRFEITVIPEISGSILEVLQDARKTGNNSKVDELCREGALPGDPLIQTAGFRVANFKILYDPEKQEDFGASVPKGGDLDVPSLNKDFVILDDLIVDGSACIGFDCVNGESFGFDTIRLKENNLRIKFDDTSVAASFPRNDWQLTANASANGGASKFSIDDISGNRTPFTVEANARSHSLYVDDGGRIGNRTSTPSTEIHTIDGDTPTLRLQQDGSSGFAPQTWDVAGNETNFFIRDVTNGSTLPFRIRPGAPTSAIFIDVDGEVGFATASPDSPVHARSTSYDPATADLGMLHVEATNNVATARNLLKLNANGPPGMFLTDTSNDNHWRFRMTSGGNFRIDDVNANGSTNGTTEFDLNQNGDLTLSGTLTITGGCTGCDAVFQPGWELESIEEHAESMWENSYLPAVGPTNEGQVAIDVFQKTTGMLQELEKAHIYIEQLNTKLKSKDETIGSLEQRIARLEELAGADH